ncbi:MAG: phenylalanine--tRNA ligase subunit beta [Acidimicrobiia bacterium]
MKVPISWLRELVAVPGDVDTVATVLQDRGLLTEAIHRPVSLDGVVVARVVECRPIEGARSVQLVVVDDGEAATREVMCGAFNFGPGDKVPLALPGARLPNGMEIGVRTVASLGVTSHGMLCAEDELGLGEDHSGILVLDSGAVVGAPVSGALGLDETVLELEITPNRPDCMAMVGVAREAGAAFGIEHERPPDDVVTSGPDAAALVTIRVEDPERCPRYAGLVVEELRIGPSPAWLARRLLAAGVRPINNVVDVTNYVMLETGQPLHAFDLDHLGGATVVVRTAAAGERITTLDGQERTCAATDLLICDGDGPVALAGVMGGLESEVVDTTTRVLIESANFAAPSVLVTSKRLGLRSEASARFERGVDPGGCVRAARRAARLLSEVAGGVVRPGVVDVSADTFAGRDILLRPGRANSLLGTALDAAEMAALLAPIEITTTVAADATLHCRVPSFRVDLEREIDLVEEVARLHGYNRIDRTLPASPERVGALDPTQAAERKLRVALRAGGLDEALTTSFVSDALYESLGWAGEARVALVNPLREEDRYLRTSLVPTLLQAAAYNVARQVESVRLHELGGVAAPAEADVLPVQTWRAALVFCGSDLENPVHTGRGRPYDVFDAKGAVELVGEALGIALAVAPPGEGVVPPGLHPGRSGAVLLEGTPIGWLGELHPQVAAALDLPRSVAVAEFDVAPLLEAHLGRREHAGVLSPFPATSYDLAFVVDEAVAAGDLVATLESAGGAVLRDVRLFDVYRGDPVPAGAKSLALEVRFQASDRTLRDEDVRPFVEAMVAAAGRHHGATQRA